MNDQVYEAFLDEFAKTAGVGDALRRAGEWAWRSGLARAGVGAGVGAGAGALSAPEGDRKRSAIKGALIGAGAGYAAPLVTRAGRKRAADKLKQWGVAQKHALTGKGDPARHIKDAKEARKFRKAQRAGLTSIPGLAKGLATRPIGTLKDAWKQQSGFGKAMTVMPVALDAPRVAQATPGEGTAQKALGTAGSTLGFLAASRLPLIPNLGVSMLTGSAAGRLGKAIDKARGASPGVLQAAASDPLTQYVPGHQRRLAQRFRTQTPPRTTS